MTTAEFALAYPVMAVLLGLGWLATTRLADRRLTLERQILEELKVAHFDTVRLAAFIAYRQGRRHPIPRGRIRRAVRTLARQGKVKAYQYGAQPGRRGRTFVQLAERSK